MRTYCRGSKRWHLDAVSTRMGLIALLSSALLLIALLWSYLSQLLFQILNQAIESLRGGRIKDIGYQPAGLGNPSLEFFPVVFLVHRGAPPSSI
jgi:hypothetical protein